MKAKLQSSRELIFEIQAVSTKYLSLLSKTAGLFACSGLLGCTFNLSAHSHTESEQASGASSSTSSPSSSSSSSTTTSSSAASANSASSKHTEAAKQGNLSAGFKALNDGESNKALEIFNAAARQHPDSPEAHHGRARALALLGRKEEAVKEFKLSILLNPPEDLARKSKEELKGLGEPVETSEMQHHSSYTPPPTVRAGDVEQSINKMLKQSEEKIKDIQNSSESYASTVYNSRSNAHNRLLEQAKQEADDMARARVRFGRRFVPAFSQADIMQRQAELQYKSASSLERSKADYDARKLEAQTRSLGVKQSVEGLESQMLNKPSETSGVFLVPTGTNLYVRNYGHFDPVMPEPPEPLHAVPLKLPQVLKMQEEHALKRGHHSLPKESVNQSSNE